MFDAGEEGTAMADQGNFVWNELATIEPERAKAFYSATLGWDFEELDLGGGPYWIAKKDGKVVGGLGPLGSGPSGTSHSSWLAFIEVDHLDERIERARGLGAQIVDEPADVPNVGRVAALRDPTGALIGWMTSLPDQG